MQPSERAALDVGVSDLAAGLNLEELFENVEAMIRDMLTGALETHPQAPEGGTSGYSTLAEAADFRSGPVE